MGESNVSELEGAASALEKARPGDRKAGDTRGVVDRLHRDAKRTKRS